MRNRTSVQNFEINFIMPKISCFNRGSKMWDGFFIYLIMYIIIILLHVFKLCTSFMSIELKYFFLEKLRISRTCKKKCIICNSLLYIWQFSLHPWYELRNNPYYIGDQTQFIGEGKIQLYIGSVANLVYWKNKTLYNAKSHKKITLTIHN